MDVVATQQLTTLHDQRNNYQGPHRTAATDGGLAGANSGTL